MGHPSYRTLVRVLRLGGAKRRFILAAARHKCGACEAQKRPAGPIVSRSPTSFVFNDVVALDLFFLNTYEKHTLPAMNIVCWGTGLQRVIHLRDQSGETLRNAYRNNWFRSYGRPASLLSTSSAASAQAFSRKKWKAMGRDWSDFEEDCDAVNQARTSKINDSGYSAYQRVFGKNLPQMEDGEWRSRP